MTFDQFMAKIDNRLSEMFGGLDSRDFPDWNYWDCWSAGDDWHFTVCDMLEENGYAI